MEEVRFGNRRNSAFYNRVRARVRNAIKTWFFLQQVYEAQAAINYRMPQNIDCGTGILWPGV